MDCRRPGLCKSDLRSRVKWFARARPSDYLLALGEAYAALPVVGKHLEPIGGFTAMGVWGYHHAPDFLSSVARNALIPRVAELRRQEREQTHEVAAAALRGIVPGDRLDVDWPTPERVVPVMKAPGQRRRYLFRRSVSYGSSPAQVLDVWRRPDLTGPAPVLIFVPGGAWVHGSRMLQGYALLSHLAEQGWVCLSIDYRVAPHNRWPQHIRDVNAAVAWARANVDQVGGDRDFVAIAGCSAGGHLAALSGLADRDSDFRGDLPADADTSVDAVVGIYGRYDWEDRSTPERERFVDFLERVVVKRRLSRDPEVFEKASPIARVHRNAPPFLVVHGTGDNVIPVAQARAFVDSLRSASRSTVGYLELPGASHGFDMTDGSRTSTVAAAIGLFLDEIHRRRLMSMAKEAI